MRFVLGAFCALLLAALPSPSNPSHPRSKPLRAKGKLTLPVLALGGEKSYGLKMKGELDDVAVQVKGGVIPESGHWIMEENPGATTKLVLNYLK